MNNATSVKPRMPESFPAIDFSSANLMPPAPFQEGEAFGLGVSAPTTDRFAGVNDVLYGTRPFATPDIPGIPRVDAPEAPVAATFDVTGIVEEAKKQAEVQQLALFRKAAKIAVQRSVVMQAIQIDDFNRIQSSLAETTDDDEDDESAHAHATTRRRRNYELVA